MSCATPLGTDYGLVGNTRSSRLLPVRPGCMYTIELTVGKLTYQLPELKLISEQKGTTSQCYPLSWRTSPIRHHLPRPKMHQGGHTTYSTTDQMRYDICPRDDPITVETPDHPAKVRESTRGLREKQNIRNAYLALSCEHCARRVISRASPTLTGFQASRALPP